MMEGGEGEATPAEGSHTSSSATLSLPVAFCDQGRPGQTLVTSITSVLHYPGFSREQMGV